MKKADFQVCGMEVWLDEDMPPDEVRLVRMVDIIHRKPAMLTLYNLAMPPETKEPETMTRSANEWPPV